MDRLEEAENLLQKRAIDEAAVPALIDIAHTLRAILSLLDTQINGA